MKSINGLCKKILALALTVMMIVSIIPMQKTNALSYSGSSSYMSGKYYRQLTAVTLTKNQRVDIVNIAKSQVGYYEGNSSSQLSGEVAGSLNYTEYARWFGQYQGEAWCAMFVSWCANLANIPTSIVLSSASTEEGLSWFKGKGQAYSRATISNGGYDPIPGDIIFFNTSPSTRNTTHIGIVSGWNRSTRTVYTVEGNTSSSANVEPNGGLVAAKSYSIDNEKIVYICKPAYTSGDSLDVGTYKNALEIDGTTVQKDKTNITVTKKLSQGTKNFIVDGWSVHSDGVSKYQYNLNGGSWQDLNGYYNSAVANSTTDYKNCTTLNSFSQNIDISSFEIGTNTINIQGITKKGVSYSIATITIGIMPPKNETYLSVAPTTVATDGKLMVTAKGAHGNAWVALFSTNDVPGSVKSYMYYYVGTSMTTFDLIGDSIKNTSTRGELTPGTYKVILFVDEKYIEDKSVTITVTATNTCCLDSPTAITTGSAGIQVSTHGWGLHSSGINKFTADIDGKNEITLAKTERPDVLNVHPSYADSCGLNVGFSDTIDTTGWLAGTHLVTIWAYPNSGSRFAVGSFAVTINFTDEQKKLTVSSNSDAVIERTAGSTATVTGISLNSDAEAVKALFNEECEIVDINGDIIANKIGTGCKILRYDNNNNVIDEIVVIVKGDLDGDAMCTSKDILRAKLFINSDTSAAPYPQAIDVSGNKTYDASDIASMADLCANQ